MKRHRYLRAIATILSGFMALRAQGQFVGISGIGAVDQVPYFSGQTVIAGDPTFLFNPSTKAMTVQGLNLTAATTSTYIVAALINTGAFTPAVAANFPTLNQNTSGTAASAAKWTTARNLAGNSVDGSANVAFTNKVIEQGTSDAGFSSAQFLGSLGTGLVKNTTSTGVLTIAVNGTDYTAGLASLASGIPFVTTGTGAVTTATGSQVATALGNTVLNASNLAFTGPNQIMTTGTSSTLTLTPITASTNNAFPLISTAAGAWTASLPPSGGAFLFPANSGGTVTLNGALGTNFTFTMTANTTLAVSNIADGEQIRALILQNATGGFTLTLGTGIDVTPVTLPGAGTANSKALIALMGANNANATTSFYTGFPGWGY